ncbi:non-ribosomal peptide synthetase [Clostridium sp. BNL1100]|uniref:non-ribosomal peptide synthetase n=1 Tax=Clostridium sp. BNL1100 TaxID=755731 RepID=UPI00024A7839|nr:non-ribosomal peptide synthetase [Clostridium sp. BNL1100]AEY66940.1 amino acid adenylation enzyme/thioester reductase family protein [Clostridium sp. BNL1100]
MYAFKTLVDLIVSRQDEKAKGITFILSETEEHFVSYSELYHGAMKLLYNLQASGFQKGDEVIFQIDNNRQFMFAFWACILGGMIPVPVTTGTNDEHKLKLFKIWDILKNPKMLASDDFFARLKSFGDKNGLSEQVDLMQTKTLSMENLGQTEFLGEIAEAEENDIAFIQFSSGSTGDPKGVIITHRNVLYDIGSVIRWVNINSEDSGLNWMPLTHDMGLIGTHIKDVIACINQYNIETQLFIRHPSLWIQKASEHKVTLLYSPNFGYKHFLTFFKPEVKKDWDLSKVRLIYNGAEPISYELCDEFLEKLSPYGLKRNSMYTVYGLAEGTIAVTFPRLGDEMRFISLDRNYLNVGDIVREVGKGDARGCSFADEGYPIYDCYVRICDSDNNDIGENKIGYICISGANVTSGYYNNEEATRKAITNNGWLNTGDLGFMRDGRLVITGRAKDVIFVKGQNYYSHDIERIAQEAEGIELGKIVAVGAFNEKIKSDELILFVLFKMKADKFTGTVRILRKLISERMGIEVSQVIPIKSIPKTTSGKVQRYKLRESYINGEFDTIKNEIGLLLKSEAESRPIDLPENEIQAKLARIWQEVLGVKKIGIKDNFFELGGDSLKITQTISRIREEFGAELEQTLLFENPVLDVLAEIVEKSDKISDDENRIQRLQEKGTLPLSYAQQRIWFLDRLNENSSQYMLYSGLNIKGTLNYDLLLKSLNTIIERHESLRTSFLEEDGLPVQTVMEGVRMELPFISLVEIPLENRRKEAMVLAKEGISCPFDLSKAPLIRGKLLQLEKDEYVLILAAHHMVFDGWSFKVLLKELAILYNSYIQNKNYVLPELKITYSDYACWQIDRYKENTIQKQLVYWKEKLGGKLPILELPFSKQRPTVQTYKGSNFRCSLSDELYQKLKRGAEQEGATLYMILLAAFKVLLFKYTGQEDIIIGSPVANRNRSELEPLIGFFTNNLVIRTAFSGNSSFRELLRNVRNVTLEAYSNQDVPFEKIVEELNLERDMSRNPLFQVFFSLQDTPVRSARLSGMSISSIDMEGDTARFDLSVDINDSGSCLEVNFEFNTDLFDAEYIVRMAEHYTYLLENLTANFETQIKKFDILSSEESKTLLEGWNNTRVDFEGDLWIRLFEDKVSINPHAVAVVKGDRQLSYSDLDTRANRLANYLVSLGVGPETIVGIYMERSIDMLTALVGVHKSGGAYLPMDPVFPKDRLEFMLDNAQVPIILTDTIIKDTLPLNKAKIICISEQWKEISEQSIEKPENRATTDNLAYVIYTSGSTGNPKGVQIEHRALTNFLLSMGTSTNICEKDRLLAVTTLSFDIAGLEMLLPLVTGASVVIAGRDEVIDGEKLISLMDKHNISIMQATPATWRMLVEAQWQGSSSLKILCGGEALPRDLANELMDRCSCLWNVYGPTETTIWSTMLRLDSKEGPVSIGKPIANTTVYILDNEMKPTAVGVPGELYIGGAGLARGYLKLPKLTQEKFITNPFSSEVGSRLYKTGDIVRFMPDGNIEFVGRSDHQVKIRGFRIELGEIETLLNKNPLISQSVVICREIFSGEKALIAYVIPKTKETDTVMLRAYLRERLPDYMIPSYFVKLDSFPMTPNNKIDRKALPIPEKTTQGANSDTIQPSNEVQKTVSDVWKEVLGRETIGINENFFDLGGHSLLLAKVRSKISKTMNIDLQVMDLFKYPTVNTLSEYLEQRLGKKTAVINNKPSIPKTTSSQSNDIAVIGMSARVPGAKNIDEFWTNLCQGRESITRFSDEEIIAEGIAPELLKKPEYVKAWGVLEDADKFDAQFFGFNPREAEILDPQQRIFLEEAWKAMEDAGCDSEKFSGAIGTFASVGMNTYIKNLTEDNEIGNVANNYQIMINNDKDFLATRVAYKLNLEGPGLTVQTACSSSMVAVHLACRSLLNKECDMALAGGVSIRLPQKTGYLYQEGMILSPDGHCRAFDEKAKGTVGGNGAGVVVLKRLEDAIAQGDNICAVIKATAVNNDGSLKVGYTAPRIEGEAGVIAKAQELAGVNPDTITYIEAHGTGTPLGDPIEIEALEKVFSEKTDKKKYCAVGSVKTNIGHLDAASGVIGLIKTVLAIKNGKIPPSLNFDKPNPKCNFENGHFYVNAKLSEWKTDGIPRRAGVSSFGIGGTNAHAVLEEAPVKKDVTLEKSRHLLIFSAKTSSALERMTSNFALHLKENPGIDMNDASYTLKLGRREFEYRCLLVCNTREEAIEAIENDNLIYANNIKNGKSYNLENLKEYTEEELGIFWLQGEKIDWISLYEGQGRNKLNLPVYPFEGQSFWAKSKKAVKKDINDYFYAPVWKQAVYNIPSELTLPENKKSILVLAKESNFENKFVELLRKAGAKVIEVNPIQQQDYDTLLTELKNQGNVPDRIINMLGISNENRGKDLFYSMLFLTKALGKQELKKEITTIVLTNGMQKVFGESVLYPEKALVLGPCRVIPREYENIKCRSVDFMLCEEGSPCERELLEQLLYEAYSDSEDTTVAYRGESRWIQSFDKMKLQNTQKPVLQIKNKGTYIITGGLGGIGLVLAEYLAEREKVKLVLVGRSSFPEMENWDEWLENKGKADKTSTKIRILKNIRELGSEILICRGNVDNMEEMQRVRQQVQNHFGKIDGVIHAAGNPGGGMIQIKKESFVENVFAPKVTGTQVLYEVLKDCKLDFFIMSSSLNSITGGFGQADYSAANNFMNAFAIAHDSRHGTRFVSVNWDRWPGIGMAIDNKKSVHPLLDRKISESPDKAVYLSRFNPKKDWVLSEHLVMGIPTIAGTTYIEMARAAFADINGDKPVEFSDVTFLTPMAVRENEEQEVLTILQRNGGHYEFKIFSRLCSYVEENPWREHAQGKIAAAIDPEYKQIDISGSADIFNEEKFDYINKDFEEFITFGNRWRTLKRLGFHGTKGFAEIELAPEFIDDLKYFNIHPSLLDVATGSVRLASKRNFLPVSYEKIIVRQRLPEKIYANITFRDEYDAPNEIITCDIDVLDEKGVQLIEIKNFSMRQISDENSENIKNRSRKLNSFTEDTQVYNSLINSSNSGNIMDSGLTAAEGRKVFEKILSGQYFNNQVIVSTKEISEAIANAGYINKKINTVAEKDEQKTLHPRPDLPNAYSAPKSEAEKRLVPVWQNLLGIEGVGIHDEFFALGGDSLLLVQLHTKIKEIFPTDLAVVDLYKYNTIALLASKLEGENHQEEKPSFKRINERVSKQQERLKQRKQRMMIQRGENH